MDIQPNNPQNLNFSEPTAEKPKLNKKLLLLIAGLIFVIGAVGATWRYFNPPTDEIVACTQDAKQCPDGSYVSRSGPDCEFEACLDPTADWQIYRNEEHNFEVKYPEGANATESPKGGGIVFVGRNEENGYGYGITIDDFGGPMGPIAMSAEYWYKEYFAIKKQEAEEANTPFFMSETGQNIQLNRYTAYKTSDFAFDHSVVNFYIMQNRNLYKIQYDDNAANDIDWIEHERIINQILSTFKFVD